MKKTVGGPTITESLMQELSEKKDLLKLGDGDSSSGSDSAPSDDNLDAAELMKNLPTVDKTLKKKLKLEAEKKNELKKQNTNALKAPFQKRSVQPAILPEPVKRISSPQKKPEQPKI